ncbi:MAG: cysteine protease [Rubrivivax sp.]|nr:cysteine protease [Rubrivivax sp.]
MIFTNPAGAPELACDECGCRWFDRMTGACYECGATVPPEAQEEFRRAVEAYAAARRPGPPQERTRLDGS